MSWILDAIAVVLPTLVGGFVTWRVWRRESQGHRARKMEAVGRLASGVAHDFNNLLTAIELCAQDLNDSPPCADRNRELAQDILEACARGSAMTRELLQVGQRSPESCDVVDVTLLIRQWMPVFQRMVGPQVTLSLGASAVSPVRIAPTQLHRVVMNLVVNASNAVEEQGRVRIEVRNHGEQVVLTVNDDGHGIPDALQLRIFEPFFTTDATRGTGLGLAVVHGVVKQVGGEIDVQSNRRGTTFRLSFPRQPAVTERVRAAEMSPVPVQRREETDTLLPPRQPANVLRLR